MGFKDHRGLLKTTYGRALATNVAWSIYVLSADLTNVHQDPGSRYATNNHDLCNHFHLIWTSRPPPTPPASPAFLPTGPSNCSWFSCLVYSSSYPQSSLSRWSVIGLFVFPESPMAAEGREQEEHAIIQRFRLFWLRFPWFNSFRQNIIISDWEIEVDTVVCSMNI